MRKEAELLQSISHENIVKFKHVSALIKSLHCFLTPFKIREIRGKIFLGMELMHAGPLTSLIQKKKSEGEFFTDEESAQIMYCIFAAMEYMHNNNIVHRDLKPGKSFYLV